MYDLGGGGTAPLTWEQKGSKNSEIEDEILAYYCRDVLTWSRACKVSQLASSQIIVSSYDSRKS